MAKFEKEIKVLNIDVEQTIFKLKNIGAKGKEKKNKRYILMIYLLFIIDIWK